MKNWGSLLFVGLHCWVASIALADAPKAVPSISASLPNAVYGKIYAQNLCPQESSNSKCDLKLQLRKGLPFPKGLELDAVRADGTADIILAAPIDSNVQIYIWQIFALSDAQKTAGVQLDTTNQGSAIISVIKFVAVQASAHTFVSFDYDRAWILPKCYVSIPYDPTSTLQPKECRGPMKGQTAWTHFGYPGLNSFFDARLTAIPVATNNPATTTGNQSGSSGGQGGTPGSTAQSNQFSTFLTSQKTAKLGTGIYMPFLVTRWIYRGQENGFAIAPLVIAGFNTLTGPTQQNVPNPNGGATTTQTFEQLYTYYGYGVRLAQYKMYEAENKAPDLQS